MQEHSTQKAALREIKVKGNQLVDKVREIIEEGNARRIIIKKDGRSVMEFPLSVGVGAASAAIFLSPTLAAIGAFASLVSDVSIAVEEHTPGASKSLDRTGTASPEATTAGSTTAATTAAGSPMTSSPTAGTPTSLGSSPTGAPPIESPSSGAASPSHTAKGPGSSR